MQYASALGEVKNNSSRTLKWVTKEEMKLLPQSRVQGKMCEILVGQELL